SQSRAASTVLKDAAPTPELRKEAVKAANGLSSGTRPDTRKKRKAGLSAAGGKGKASQRKKR
ncbi:MAG: hypothetical protein M3Y56_05580, partial [Armatimonadota bacterium]|nr:hypothetical protein [Armatimonadota bacterium]